MDYETEEQQLEAIKKWWNENSTMVISGDIVGVSAIFGWQTYQDYSVNHNEQASVIYEQVSMSLQNADSINDQMVKVNRLEAEYSDTPYAALSAMLLAKQHMAAGEFVKAQQQLQWVIDHSRQDETRYLAQLRLARLLLSTDKPEQALQLASETYPQSFQAMAYELKGDALLLQGKSGLAREAYQQALSLSENPGRWLQLKIDDTGFSDNDKAC